MFSWARGRRLHADPRYQRIWFGRSDEGAQEITYRARVREATRTVTKPVLAADGERVRFWQHDAVRFRFRRYDDSWLLHLIPTVVFTVDGRHELFKGGRMGAWATRALARDYNPQVQADLYFWRWVLCGEEIKTALDGEVCLRSSFPARDLIDAPAADGWSPDEVHEPADVFERDLSEEPS